MKFINKKLEKEEKELIQKIFNKKGFKEIFMSFTFDFLPWGFGKETLWRKKINDIDAASNDKIDDTSFYIKPRAPALKESINQFKSRFEKKEIINHFVFLKCLLDCMYQKELLIRTIDSFLEGNFLCSSFLLAGVLELLLRNFFKKQNGDVRSKDGKTFKTLGQIMESEKNQKIIDKAFDNLIKREKPSKYLVERSKLWKKKMMEYIKWLLCHKKGNNFRNRLMHIEKAELLFNEEINNDLFHLLCFMHFLAEQLDWAILGKDEE